LTLSINFFLPSPKGEPVSSADGDPAIPFEASSKFRASQQEHGRESNDEGGRLNIEVKQLIAAAFRVHSFFSSFILFSSHPAQSLIACLIRIGLQIHWEGKHGN
jgi:hypothetical protein